MFRIFARRFVRPFLVSIALLTIAAPAHAGGWQCVTYARHVSDIEIRGNAHTWWAQAEGVYERGAAPRVGAVMVMRPHGSMRVGHVAMVREVVNDREIRLNHANWSRRGMAEPDVLARDVSPNNDWSEVQVWYGPIGDLGTTVYPIYGFIYPDAAPETSPVRMASTDAPANAALLANYGNRPVAASR